MPDEETLLELLRLADFTGLNVPHARINASRPNQVLMSPLLPDLSLVQYVDHFGMANCGKAMGNDDCGTAGRELAQ